MSAFETVLPIALACVCSIILVGMTPEPLAVQPEDREEEWWVQRHRERLQLAATGEAELILIGDSITHGWEDIGQALFAKYYAHRAPLNLGYSGDRTEHVLWRLQHGELHGLKPKLVMLLIGTNNTGHRQDIPQHTAHGIRAILDEIHTRVPAAKVLLLGLFPRGATTDDPQRVLNRQINEIISGYGEDSYVEYLDLGDTFIDEKGNLKQALMPDLLHPSSAGYGAWARAMEPRLSELLGDARVVD